MNFGEWLKYATTMLAHAGITSARLDAELILAKALDKDREYLHAHGEDTFETSLAYELLQRRVGREPLAYILSQKEFYGRDFIVTPDVLIPRPESENFIELLKEHLYKDGPYTVVDVGTGSGILAITAALELPGSRVLATDVDEQALKIAQANASAHKVDIDFFKGSLLEPLYDIKLKNYVILTNLPYVPEELITSPEIEQEPKTALFSGKDGLDHYRKFWQQVSNLKSKPSYILTESLKNQHALLQDLAKKSGYTVQETNVLIQVFVSSNY